MNYSFIFEKQKIKYYLTVIVGFFFAFWILGYVRLISSDEYKFAIDYLKSDQIVKDNLGPINSSRAGLGNFSKRYSGGVWRTKFNVVLKAEKKTGTVYLDLEGSENGWAVLDARLSLDDKLINLKPNTPVNK